MKITLLTVGTRGDIQPYIALGIGLQKAGHTVRLATSLDFKPLVEDHGLDFFPMIDSIQPLLSSKAGQKIFTSGSNTLSMLHGQSRLIGNKLIATALMNSWLACQGAEIIVSSFTAFWGYDIAQKLDIPFYITSLVPNGFTQDFPHPWVPPTLNLGRTFNRSTYRLFRNWYWQIHRQAINEWRSHTLRLPPWKPWQNPFAEMLRQRVPRLYLFSPSFIPKPSDWPEEAVVTGYCFLDNLLPFSPPQKLVDFLNAGKPPFCISFGSIVDSDSEALTGIVLKALSESQQRGILLTEWSGMNEMSLSNDVYVERSVPHHWLLPRVSAFVHHGGAGTMGAALRAGLPSIVIPFFAEGPFWGHRLAKQGLGPQPIPRKRLTVARLSEAIQTVANDLEIQSRAAAMGELIRAEDGVSRAIAAMVLQRPQEKHNTHGGKGFL